MLDCSIYNTISLQKENPPRESSFHGTNWKISYPSDPNQQFGIISGYETFHPCEGGNWDPENTVKDGDVGTIHGSPEGTVRFHPITVTAPRSDVTYGTITIQAMQ